MLHEELQRLNDLNLDFSNCDCHLRNSCGLTCACILSIYLNSGERIPLNSIDIFWRTLEISDSRHVENDDICCDVELEKFKENFNKQSEAGKRTYLRKLKDIVEPGTTNIEEPAIQKNPRGRPSTKKQQKKHANPPSKAPQRRNHSIESDFDEFDLNKEPEGHSSSFGIDLNDEPQGHDPFIMDRIPNVFHNYIETIQDILGDGNCGFRAVAICLGYGEDQWLYIRQQCFQCIL